MIPLLIALHALAAIGWVGGMFFAHMALRPAALNLEPPLRLRLWRGVFSRFFPWVWVFVATLLASGHLLLAQGFGLGSHAVLTMAGLGWLMAALFAYLYFRPYRQLLAALDRDDIPAAAAAQNHIRRIVSTNLLLGLLTSALGVTARFFG